MKYFWIYFCLINTICLSAQTEDNNCSDVETQASFCTNKMIGELKYLVSKPHTPIIRFRTKFRKNRGDYRACFEEELYNAIENCDYDWAHRMIYFLNLLGDDKADSIVYDLLNWIDPYSSIEERKLVNESVRKLLNNQILIFLAIEYSFDFYPEVDTIRPIYPYVWYSYIHTMGKEKDIEILYRLEKDILDNDFFDSEIFRRNYASFLKPLINSLE